MADLLIKITLAVMLVTGAGMLVSQAFYRDVEPAYLTVSEIIEQIEEGIHRDERERSSKR